MEPLDAPTEIPPAPTNDIDRASNVLLEDWPVVCDEP
jgi:hypothetical protein